MQKYHLLHYRPTQDLEQIEGIMFNYIYIPCIKKAIHLGVPLYSTKYKMFVKNVTDQFYVLCKFSYIII